MSSSFLFLVRNNKKMNNFSNKFLLSSKKLLLTSKNHHHQQHSIRNYRVSSVCRTATTATLSSINTPVANQYQYYYDGNHQNNKWIQFAATATTGLLMLSSMFSSSLSSQCEQEQQEQQQQQYHNKGDEEELPVFGSSSDPMIYSTVRDDDISTIEADASIIDMFVIRQNVKDSSDNAASTPASATSKSEMENPKSDINKSIRAMETGIETLEQQQQEQLHHEEQQQQKVSATSPVVALINKSGNKIDTSSGVDVDKKVTTRKMYFYRTPKIQQRIAKKFILLAGPSSIELGNDIAHLLGLDLNQMEIGSYNDGEVKIDIHNSVRGKHVYIVNSTTSIDSIIELCLLITALRRASAKSITAVIPYFGYARQDRKTSGKREPIAAADVALMLEEMGIDQIMCMDLHSDTLRGFFNPKIPVDHIIPIPVAAAYFHEELNDPKQKRFTGIPTKTDKESPKAAAEPTQQPKITVVASHEGQVARAAQFRAVLQRLSGKSGKNDDGAIELAVICKTRSKNDANSTNDDLLPDLEERDKKKRSKYQPKLVGNVKGRKCIIVDDIVNTGGTLFTNVQHLKELGAEEIYCWATHGIFVGDSKDTPNKIDKLHDLEYLLISNSVDNNARCGSKDKNGEVITPITTTNKIRQLNLAPLLAEAIARALHDQSISNILNLDNMNYSRYDDDGYYN